MSRKTLTIALMDPPYESENLTTAFRILDVAARRGYHINVFAYEGAAGLAFVRQTPHPNPVHGKDVAEENHPTTKDQVAALLAAAETKRRQGGLGQLWHVCRRARCQRVRAGHATRLAGRLSRLRRGIGQRSRHPDQVR